MRIVIFGATGGIGRCLVDQALAKGHVVTAAVRDPARMPATHEQLRVERCDVLDAACVAAAVDGHDAVLCALGTEAGKPTTVYSAGTANIIAAMEDKGVRRLVIVSNFCVLSETPRDLWKSNAFPRKDLTEERPPGPETGAGRGPPESPGVGGCTAPCPDGRTGSRHVACCP